MKAFIPDPGGSGVVAVLAAADAAARLTEAGTGLFAGYRQRYMLGTRDAEVLDAADEALDLDDRPLDLDDWATDTWWLEQPAGGSS
ncbi:MAG: hypothetical protein PGN30_00035 [Mycolicibacterium neoaurum]|uniref:hypothetical protein n=1 Tax=Mycolicibacterium neoaurum TaxID=1795 RepID=UPI002FF90073